MGTTSKHLCWTSYSYSFINQLDNLPLIENLKHVDDTEVSRMA